MIRLADRAQILESVVHGVILSAAALSIHTIWCWPPALNEAVPLIEAHYG